jgi:serine/threonine protein kinase
MADYQVLGSYIVSEKMRENPVGTMHRGIVAPDGTFDKFVFINRFDSGLTGFQTFFKALGNQFRIASKLNGAFIASVEGVQQVDGEDISILEFADGKFLDEAIRRSTEEGFPFSIDHVLLIASKTSAALAYCYEKGSTYGFLSPSSIHLSFEGDVKLYDTLTAPLMPSLLNQNPEKKAAFADYIHPDVWKNGKGGQMHDVFSIGAIIFKLLTGKSFLEGGRLPADIKGKLEGAVLGSSSFGDDPIPDDVKDILLKAFDINGGYKSVQEFNEVLENLIFSGDYSPTTFNLAFFMHSLYREQSEQSAKLLDMEKTANYAGYFVSSGEGFGEAKKMSKGLLMGLIAVVVVVAVAGGYFFMQKKKAEEKSQLAQQKITQEIAKQKDLEKQKNEEIAKMRADMDARVKKIMGEVQKEADQKAKAILMKRAEDERKKQMEQIQKAEQEKKRIETETRKKEALLKKQQEAEKQKEEAALAEKKKEQELKKKQEEEARQKKLAEQKKVEDAKKALYGQVVGLSQIDVAPKVIFKENPKVSPAWHVRGTMSMMALIDENGNTTEVKVINGLSAAGRSGKLAERRIVDTVKKWKYTPGMKDGVAVKVWISIRITI